MTSGSGREWEATCGAWAHREGRRRQATNKKPSGRILLPWLASEAVRQPGSQAARRVRKRRESQPITEPEPCSETGTWVLGRAAKPPSSLRAR